MIVLGIESSCDETGVAIYCGEKGLLAHQLYSQIALHAQYGGVVPELASRDHIRKLPLLVNAAIEEAGINMTWANWGIDGCGNLCSRVRVSAKCSDFRGESYGGASDGCYA